MWFLEPLKASFSQESWGNFRLLFSPTKGVCTSDTHQMNSLTYSLVFMWDIIRQVSQWQGRIKDSLRMNESQSDTDTPKDADFNLQASWRKKISIQMSDNKFSSKAKPTRYRTFEREWELRRNVSGLIKKVAATDDFVSSGKENVSLLFL